ncbi:DNA-directed RNA polymerase I subunit RPA2-like [Homarus americanus]|uniref:DNA-directed RNA polymerase subunit beta n=1 Tax=Homarus americanus TaxID=6706 RepID=A0A8J5K4M8_HOMAM|nr:DNA-directed RNA polymerase I subunit RPA2-like [Homarus americanus]
MGASKKTVELSLKHLKVPNFGKIPQTQNEAIQALAAPHVESFNFLLQEGLQAVVSNIPPLEFATDNGNRISLKIANVAVGRPRLPPGAGETVDYNIYPKECIERGCSYTAPFAVSFEWTRDKQEMLSFRQSLGDVPIIVRSKKCNLYNLSPKELVKHGEMLSSNRRNYPLAMTRESWKKRNISYTDKGVLIRCVQADQTSAINVLHYLTTGEAKLEFAVKRELFFVPLIMILKALMDYSDQQIYQHLIRGRENDMYFTEKIKNMMRDLHAEGLYTQKVCKEYIGNSFRHRLTDNLPEWYTDVEVCDFLLHQNVLIHLKTNAGKFHMICMMARKLYSFVNGETKAEFVDAFSMQEVALGGHTYLQLLKEKLTDLLISIKIQVRIKNRREGRLWVVEDGLTVVIEHLNRMRDLSHLRAIHRGAFFVDMKTIEPRRLTGEAWGFICPVHTPDGAPCGLLNHLAQNCIVLSDIPKNPKALSAALTMLGMTPIDIIPLAPYAECLEVILDGCLVGYIRMDESEEFTQKLRIMKSQEEIWKYTEIVLIPKRKYGGQYPGLFLVTSIARMMRPVINLTTYSIEYIGTLEQLYLNVAITPEDIEDGVHTHLEVDKTSLFSNIGKLVPFSDCNPNPRNMYQCQMGKQTMGTPFHNWRAQTTGKAYRLQYPQVPLVRNSHYDDINMEEFCMGFNAVIAIISYTGFDMEDAMVLNKCSMERGLGHGQIYKTEFIDLSMLQGKGKGPTTEISFVFRRNPHEPEQKSVLDSNGLPYPGTQLTEVFLIYDNENFVPRSTRVKIVLWISTPSWQPRNPIIGDKFASRSGQKGIMSRLYPVEDLPFSERGIMPDIIFNPHGIPSRMTAGKLIELVAGKSAAEFGKSFDSTPFEFSDENPAHEYFGKILEKAGFNYYGEDVLYSGVDGRMLEVEIFEGVRATGAVDMVTHQPVKGRKRGGAIRFGEMERDCLISHGAAYTLKDRLLDCSDISLEWVCEECGGILSPSVRLSGGTQFYGKKQPECVVCGPKATVRQLHLPYAFKYLVAELASVGLKTQLELRSAEDIITSKPIVQSLNET